MGYPFHINLFFQYNCNERTKYFTFLIIGIKTVLFIRTENETRPRYIIIITCILNHNIYYTDKGILKRVNLCTEKITC